MMDYNAHMAALTPCQIGKVLMNMARPGSIQRNILIPTWCTLDTGATIIVADSVRWKGSMDVEGNIIIERNAVLEIDARISLPAGAQIEVRPGARLILMSGAKLHNACGDMWKGIQLVKEKKNSGTVFMMEGAKIENTSLNLTTMP
jgi:hypothetical protein